MRVWSIPSESRRIVIVAAVVLTAFLLAFTATKADAQIYFGGQSSFIQTTPLGGGKAKRAVDSRGDGLTQIAANNNFLFWSNAAGQSDVGTVNRSTHDGKGFNARLVKGASNVSALTASGRYLYFGLNNSIGRSTTSGSSAKLNFVAGTGTPVSIAVGGGYIYWSSAAGTSIGRANLDGSSPNPDFIANVPGYVNDLAVSGSNIYWSNAGGTAIGDAATDGSAVNPTFITGMAQVGEIDIFGNFIYWTDFGGQIGPCGGPSCIPSVPGPTAGSIDRANLDGTGMKSIVKRLNNPNTLAVIADPKRK
jgi:hypothetical protein